MARERLWCDAMDATDAVPQTAGRPVPKGGGRGVAVAAVLVSALISLAFGPLTLWLVREQLHIGCATYPAGTEGAGTWSCADGIGYLFAAAALGGMWVLTVLLGSLIAGLVRNGHAARIGLWLLSLGAGACVLGWYWSTSLDLVVDEHSPVKAEAIWAAAMAPAAVIAAAAIVCGGVSLFLRGRVATGVAIAAAGIMTVAVGVQPGLGLNLLPVAGVLAALAARSSRPGR